MNIHSALAQENAQRPPLRRSPPRCGRAQRHPAMVAYWDAGLRKRLANDAYLDWFGVTSDELHGMHIQDLLSDAVLQPTSLHRQSAQRRTAILQTNAHGRAGATVFTEVSYMPDLREGGTSGFFVMVTDITGRVLAERRQQRDTDGTGHSRAASPGSLSCFRCGPALPDRRRPGAGVLRLPLHRAGRQNHPRGARRRPGQRAGAPLPCGPVGQEVSWSRRIGHRTTG